VVVVVVVCRDVGDELLGASFCNHDASRTRGWLRSAVFDSPSSMRKPRIFTWWSFRPMNSKVPSGRHRARFAGPVKAGVGYRGERVGDEFRGRQLGLIRIAAREAIAAEKELADAAHPDKGACAVQK